MDLSIGQDREMLRDTLSRFFGKKFDWERRLEVIETDEGFDRDLWNEVAELGMIGALFGEDAGGFGGSAVDVGVVFAEVGRAIVTGPFLGTLLAGKLLEQAGEQELLADVIGGERIVAFAHEPMIEAGGGEPLDVTAQRDGDDWRLDGAKGVVDYLGSADRIVVTADTGKGRAAFLLSADAEGVSVSGYDLVDGGSGGELRLDGAKAQRLDGIDDAAIETALAYGLVALCWEGVAVMEKLRDQTLDYLRQRKQFGVPIGKFQALQHRMATLALEIEQARSAAINAAANFDKGADQRDRFVAAGKYTVSRVGTLAAEEAIQMHGGIGMTWELPLSHFAKRMTLIGHILGDEDEHLSRYIELTAA
ncbi:acyl-CoA dehydrogenase family protein [Sphingomicrobium sp. XHP0239]|uniref:acyl-CoA dehydrogenase family protein n=1 Tax=Sphingomicrobium maritimum TaxID=3133972 RepID=UPI0031CCA30D